MCGFCVTCSLPFFIILVALVLNGWAAASLPYTGPQGFFSIYTFSISFSVDTDGTLNTIYPYYNLSSILVGNWGVCFIDNQTFNTFSQHDILCTPPTFLYPITLENVIGDQIEIPDFTILKRNVSVLFYFHAVAFFASVFAGLTGKKGLTSYFALLAAASQGAAYGWDLIFFFHIRRHFASPLGISTKAEKGLYVGSISAAIISASLLFG